MFWPEFHPNTIHYGFWSTFHLNDIYCGFWPNFHPNTIDYGFWPNFDRNTRHYGFWLNFHPNTMHYYRLRLLARRPSFVVDPHVVTAVLEQLFCKRISSRISSHLAEM